MTVSAQTLAFEYAANGVTTTFPYGFRVLYADQVKVYVNGTLQVGGYTLTGVGDAGGGNVVFSVAPINGSTVLVRRISDRVRSTDFQQAPYFTQEELLDIDQDYQTMLLQEAAADATNALRIPAVETNSVTLPDAADRANKAIVFDEFGNVGVSEDDYADQAAAAAASAAAALASENAAEAAAIAAEASADRVDLGALDQAVEDSEAARDAAQLAETNAELAEANAELAESNAETAQAAAEAARDAALLSRGVFASTADALSKGVASLASLVAGSGGTNGTFDLAFSGGAGTGAAGRFVVAGGAVVSTVITATGRGYTSAPTVSFAASSGLTGASATAVIANNADVGEYFSVPGSVDFLQLYRVDTGPVATAVGSPYPSTATVLKIAATALGKNLYNFQTVTAGAFMAPNGSVTVLAGFSYSDFIPVVAGTQYIISGKQARFTAYFDSGKAVVAGGTSTAISTFTPPAGVAFVRITIEGGGESTVQLEAGSVATAFEAYGYYLLSTAVRVGSLNGNVIAAGSINGSALVDSSVTDKKLNFFTVGKNLYNFHTITNGGFMGPDGVVTVLAGFSYSDFIPVIAGIQYVISGKQARFTAYFNASKVNVAGGSSSSISTFTPPAGAAFVRITIEGGGESTVQLEAGSVATAFERNAQFLKIPNGTPIVLIKANWVGKSWASLGDSITAQDRWQPSVSSALGLVHTNYGVSGTTLKGPPGSTTAMCQDARINAIPTTTDLVTVLAGVNDWAQDTPLGAATSTDPLTYNGALNTLMSKMSTRFPAKRVVLMTPTYGELYDYPVSQGWPNAFTNLVGLTMLDYAEAVRAAGKRWGTPVIDISGKAGWNTVNIRTYIGDDGGLLHPNAAGGLRMAEVTIGDLEAIGPIM